MDESRKILFTRFTESNFELSNELIENVINHYNNYLIDFYINKTGTPLDYYGKISSNLEQGYKKIIHNGLIEMTKDYARHIGDKELLAYCIRTLDGLFENNSVVPENIKIYQKLLDKKSLTDKELDIYYLVEYSYRFSYPIHIMFLNGDFESYTLNEFFELLKSDEKDNIEYALVKNTISFDSYDTSNITFQEYLYNSKKYFSIKIY